jgi:hypothetical protein
METGEFLNDSDFEIVADFFGVFLFEQQLIDF